MGNVNEYSQIHSNMKQFSSMKRKETPSTHPHSHDVSFMKLNDMIAPLLASYPKYKRPNISEAKTGPIQVYGVNSYRGLVKKYNEDRVSIILNITKPERPDWPKQLSIFGLFDGHSGSKCCDFLRDNFHLYFIKSELFPRDIKGAINDAFTRLENDFLSKFAISQDNSLLDKSGSCALVTIIIDNMVYIANVGDSRAIMSNYKGEEIVQLTEDHKPNARKEKKRIKQNEGIVYKVNSFQTLYRILPGNLSVSRTIGDASSKVPFLGGKLGVVISTPDIISFRIDETKNDFIVMGSDGIFDKLDNEDLVKSIWSTLDYSESIGRTAHEQAGICSDMAIKLAMNNRSKDNVSAIFIGFKNFVKEYNNKIEAFNTQSRTFYK